MIIFYITFIYENIPVLRFQVIFNLNITPKRLHFK